jgi:hypothetical protein
MRFRAADPSRVRCGSHGFCQRIRRNHERPGKAGDQPRGGGLERDERKISEHEEIGRVRKLPQIGRFQRLMVGVFGGNELGHRRDRYPWQGLGRGVCASPRFRCSPSWTWRRFSRSSTRRRRACVGALAVVRGNRPPRSSARPSCGSGISTRSGGSTPDRCQGMPLAFQKELRPLFSSPPAVARSCARIEVSPAAGNRTLTV